MANRTHIEAHASVISIPFTVYTGKRFPGMEGKQARMHNRPII
jgi:hypothetical protein